MSPGGFMKKLPVPNTTPVAALVGSLRDHRAPKGANLVNRVGQFYEWQDLRRQNDLWPYSRATETAPMAHCEAKTDDGREFSGVNFASQDYLSLSSHPRIKQAAVDAIEQYGVHSAGSAALLGNTANSIELERKLSSVMNGREIVLYPTGWSAGFGSIQGFVRPDDHIVIDILAHSCLQEGAKAATQNIHYHPHLSNTSVERKLKHIRKTNPEAGVLVVTESLFSMHSDVPDFKALRQLCDKYNATLLVDCAHDFGSMGEDGLGNLGKYAMVDEADIIITSFSKTFASNGGFIAVRDKAAAEYLKYYSATHTFTNALSPVQAATVMAAIDIVYSDEGKVLREKLMDNILYLRAEMEKAGLEVLGEASPIVPVRIGGEELGRFTGRNLPKMGGIANLVEYPAVPRGDSRFRFQVMASHTHADIDQVVQALVSAMRLGRLEMKDRVENEADAPHSLRDTPKRRPFVEGEMIPS